MSTPIRPLKPPQQAGLPDRLHNALLWRAEQAKVSLDDVARSVGMPPEILTAKRSDTADRRRPVRSMPHYLADATASFTLR
jgi:hypothetical protein